MSASFKINVDALKKLADRVSGPNVKTAFEAVANLPSTIALIGQAIGDNFEQEGPGWAPLKAATIRGSVNKKTKKLLSDMTDDEILAHERKARKPSAADDNLPFRKILQRSGRVLKKSVTQVGAKGNIFKVKGTTIVWGSSLVYAEAQNDGYADGNLPAREFLALRPEWQNRLNAHMLKQYKEYLKGLNI